MFCIFLPIIFTLLTQVSSRSLQQESTSTGFGWHEPKSEEKLPQQADLNFGPPLHQMFVLQMHYDCQGRLVRQEASKLKFITGLFLIPEENDIILKAYKRSEPSDLALEESNELNMIDDGVSQTETPVYFKYIDEGVSQTEAPLYFKSIAKRVRPKPSISQSVEDIGPVNVTIERTSFIPPVKAKERNRKFKIIFDPDRIIDVPVRACPFGENEDVTGKCRPVFPEA